MIELFHELAELSTVLARIGQVIIEDETPIAEPDLVEEFLEVGEFTHV